MAGDAFIAGENMVGTGKVQKMNQKTRFRGTGAEVSAMSGDDGPHPGQEVFISSTGSGFTVDKVYRRNNADTAWQEMADVSNGRAFDSNLFGGLGVRRYAGALEGGLNYRHWDMDSEVITDQPPWILSKTASMSIVGSFGNEPKWRFLASVDTHRGYITHNDKDNYRRQRSTIMEVLLQNSTLGNWEMRCGFTDGALGTAGNAWPQGTNYACLEYDKVARGDDLIYLESSDGTRSHLTSGYTNVSNAKNVYRLELEDNVEGSANEFRLYRNGTLLATKTTNLPATATPMQPFVYAEKVNTTTVQVDVFSMTIMWKSLLISA